MLYVQLVAAIKSDIILCNIYHQDSICMFNYMKYIEIMYMFIASNNSTFDYLECCQQVGDSVHPFTTIFGSMVACVASCAASLAR